MKKTWMFFLCLLTSSSAFASAHWAPLIAAGGGIANSINLGESIDFPIEDPNQDQYFNYSPDDESQTKGLFEVFVGLEYPFVDQWLLQIGAAYTQSGTFTPEGTLVQGVDVQSEDTYRYEFDLLTRQIMVQTKWMRRIYERFYPYGLFGIGVAINTASDFTTTAPTSLTFTRLYADDTTTTFAYRFGVGLDVDLWKNVRLGLAYRITDLGGYSLGQAFLADTEESGTISQSAVYANEVLAQVSFHF